MVAPWLLTVAWREAIDSEPAWALIWLVSCSERSVDHASYEVMKAGGLDLWEAYRLCDRHYFAVVFVATVSLFVTLFLVNKVFLIDLVLLIISGRLFGYGSGHCGVVQKGYHVGSR